MRYKLLLSYDGSPFCGWQIQTKDPSVQECLQKALKTLLREEIEVTGAGRTDTGVNAMFYCAHFDCRAGLDAEDLCYKLNAILPPSVCMHSVSAAPDGFHARFSAVSRTYMYFIHKNKDPFMDRRSYRLGYPLDVDEMNRAAQMLLGTRDFGCFEKKGGDNKTSICTVTRASWTSYVPERLALAGITPGKDDYLVFTVTADRFLRNMVRAIVGTLLEIGRGRRNAEWMKEVLDSGNRSVAGESVPGHALFLTEVKYPEI